MQSLAVSTMWGAQGRYPDLGDMVDGVRAAGGERIEINYMPTRAQLEQLLARPDLVVSSVHNICPRPTDATGTQIPDPSLTAEDEAARQHAVALAKATMDLACRVGADAIVVHSGDLPALQDNETRLQTMYRENKSDTDEYLSLRARIASARADLGGPARARLIASLTDLVPYAEATGVRIGLETRQDYRDLPSIEDLSEIFARLTSPMLGYWHDTGHAERQANLGFAPHEAWLERFGDRLVAVHLHDCEELRDHLIPGRGRINFGKVVSYLCSDTVPVCELDHYYEIADIREGLDYLRAMGFESGGAGA